jgi:hypothetical protein
MPRRLNCSTPHACSLPHQPYLHACILAHGSRVAPAAVRSSLGTRTPALSVLSPLLPRSPVINTWHDVLAAGRYNPRPCVHGPHFKVLPAKVSGHVRAFAWAHPHVSDPPWLHDSTLTQLG